MTKEEITIPCTGYTVAADFYAQAPVKEILLVFVGYGSSKDRNSTFVTDVITKADMSALVIDFSGHGKSPFDLNDTRPAQHLLEAISAFDWVKDAYPEAEISVMGTSYGGFMAAYLTRFRQFKKLVLRTPAVYKPADFYSHHAQIDKLGVRDYRANADAVKVHPLFMQESIKQVPTLLVIHGKDESIPVATTDIYQAAFSAETYTASDFKHALSDPMNPREQFDSYSDNIAKWLIK